MRSASILSCCTLVCAVLAGCSGNGPATPGIIDGGLPEDADQANVTIATLGPAIDLWSKGEVEKVLFDDEVEAGECYPQAYVWEASAGYVMGGCSYFALPDGVLIPPGTATIRIEADATDALKSGSYYAFFYSRHRSYPEADLEATSEPIHTWEVALRPTDWDTPETLETYATFGYWTAGTGTSVPVLMGPIHTRIVAVRDPDWNATETPDPWADPTLHAYPQPDVLTLLDTNTTLSCGSMVGPACTEFPGLQDLVPIGATHLVFAAKHTEVAGCPQEMTCNVRTPFTSGDRYTAIGGVVQDEVGPGWRILVYDDTMFVVDSLYTNESVSWFDPWLDVCLPGEETPSCNGTGIADVSTDIRYVIEAWRGPVDLDAVKRRIGV